MQNTSDSFAAAGLGMEEEKEEVSHPAISICSDLTMYCLFSGHPHYPYSSKSIWRRRASDRRKASSSPKSLLVANSKEPPSSLNQTRSSLRISRWECRTHRRSCSRTFHFRSVLSSFCLLKTRSRTSSTFSTRPQAVCLLVSPRLSPSRSHLS